MNDRTHIIIDEEKTAFRLPEATTTFLSPQSDPMIGWKRTKPSYEEEYTPDAPMTAKSKYGKGYTFPCLFHVGNEGWVLVSETGTHGNYPGCRLADYNAEEGYRLEFPMEGECDGRGARNAAFPLPGATPWRTITVGETLKPIVETTVSFDVVKPLYEASEQYKPGRYVWSWLIWQDMRSHPLGSVQPWNITIRPWSSASLRMLSYRAMVSCLSPPKKSTLMP